MSSQLNLLIVVLIFAFASQICAQKNTPGRLPVIDMHIHAHPIAEFGGGKISICSGDGKMIFPAIDPKFPFRFEDVVECTSKVKSSLTDHDLMIETLAKFEQYNIRRAVTSGPLDLVTKWHNAAPEKIIPALSFGDRDPSPSEFRKLFREGKFRVFAENGIQYRGFSPSDEKYEPYFALAEELDIPVAVHLGEGPPGGVHTLGPAAYRVRLGSPLLLEEVLVRHPKLRVYVMHYGSPLVDEMIAMLYSHSNLYVDIACNNWGFPRKQFYDHLRRMIEAGFEKRIMFGTDQMAWPGTIDKAVESIQNAPFLTPSQKRDIFYNNAARFLRLTQAEIRRDHTN